MSEVKEQGLNIWAMLAIFKRRSKLSPQIPDDVIQAICGEYLNRKGTLRADFPYFLEVLKRKSLLVNYVIIYLGKQFLRIN